MNQIGFTYKIPSLYKIRFFVIKQRHLLQKLDFILLLAIMDMLFIRCNWHLQYRKRINQIILKLLYHYQKKNN
jgi:hypothetical protein